MTAQDTSLLIGALVGVMGALQAWLTARSVRHERALNGLMAPRIAEGAAAVVLADHANRMSLPTAGSDAARQARIAALQAELDTLRR